MAKVKGLASGGVKVEVRNVETNKRRSRETACFSAKVFVDGVFAGWAENAGHGGCNEYFWEREDLGRKAEDWAKVVMKDSYEPLDGLIGRLMDEAEEKANDRKMKAKGYACKLVGRGRPMWKGDEGVRSDLYLGRTPDKAEVARLKVKYGFRTAKVVKL